MNTVLIVAQVSLLNVMARYKHSVSNHLTAAPCRRFNTQPLSATGFSGLHHGQASSPDGYGRIEFVSYGLLVHVQLLSTPPHGGAVTFHYGPECACPERTFTSLNHHAHRRTHPGLQPGAARQPLSFRAGLQSREVFADDAPLDRASLIRRTQPYATFETAPLWCANGRFRRDIRPEMKSSKPNHGRY